MLKITFKIYPKPGKADKGKKIIKKERPVLVVLSVSQKVIEDGKARTVTRRYNLSSGLEIDPAQWNTRRQEPKDTYKAFAALMNELKAFKEAVTDACHAIDKEGGEITAPAIRERLDGKAGGSNKTPELTPAELFAKAMDDYIEISTETKRPSTIKVYRTVFARLKEYEAHIKKPLTFDALGQHFHEHYRAWMLKSGSARTGKERLLDDTVNNHFTILKTFMRWGYDRKLHTNDQYKQFKAAGQAKVENISLTEAELLQLQGMDLTGCKRLDKVRDLLIFACYTGQRWSDLQGFSKGDLKGKVWRFVSKKTGKRIAIPLDTFAAPAWDVLVKYDFVLPKISDVNFNLYVKELGELAGISEPVKIKRLSGSKEVVKEKPKHAFMCSHMARRTFITILLSRGVAPTLIMKFTGHTDLATLMRYEHSQEEVAFEALRNVGQLGQSAIRKAV